MARPKKDKNLRHTRHIMLRLTNTEYEIIAENAKATSLPLAEYVRKQITNKKVIVKYEIVADLPELKKLIAEFGKIGSNLNQIAFLRFPCPSVLARSALVPTPVPIPTATISI